jgi:hypothetical protein
MSDNNGPTELSSKQKEVIKKVMTNALNDMLAKDGDDLLFVEIGDNNLAETLVQLLHHNYHIFEDLWEDERNHEYFIVNTKNKHVLSFNSLFYEAAKDINLPFYTVESMLEHLSLH